MMELEAYRRVLSCRVLGFTLIWRGMMVVSIVIPVPAFAAVRPDAVALINGF